MGITTDNILNEDEVSAVVFTGTAEAGATVTVRVEQAGTEVVTSQDVIADANGNWQATFDLSAVTDGATIVLATAEDVSGNLSNEASVNFSIDTAAAPLAITAPTDGSLINSDQVDSVDITGTFENNQQVFLTLTDSLRSVQLGPISVDGTGAWSVNYDFSGFEEGNIVIQATGTDTQGNDAQSSVTVILDTLEPALQIDDLQTVNDDNVVDATEVSTYQVEGTGEADLTVTFDITDSAGTVVSGSAVVGTDGTWSAAPGTSLSTLQDGLLTIVATEQDDAGNIATDTHTITLDLTTDDVTINSPITTDNILNEDEVSAVVFTGTAEAGATITVRVEQAGTEVVTSQDVIADANGNWQATFDLSAVTDGATTVLATAEDVSGNLSNEASVNFSIDTAAAPLAITAPTDGSLINSDQVDSVDITGTFENNQQVFLTLTDSLRSVQLGPISVDGTGAWSVNYDFSGFEEGNIVIQATGTDKDIVGRHTPGVEEWQKLLAGAHLLTVPAGETILYRGEPSESVYFVVEGACEAVNHVGQAGQPRLEGDGFGYSSLFVGFVPHDVLSRGAKLLHVEASYLRALFSFEGNEILAAHFFAWVALQLTKISLISSEESG